MYGTIRAEVIRGGGGRWASRPRPWVACVTARDAVYGFAREFQRGAWDYTYANGKRGGRGIYIYWSLAPGLYEIYRPVSWNPRSDERFFFRVDEGGELHEITRQEAIDCLTNAILA